MFVFGQTQQKSSPGVPSCSHCWAWLVCLVSQFLKSLLCLCCLSPTALTFILNIHIVLPLLPFSWSFEIFNNVSKKDEVFLYWASQCLTCFHPNFCNLTFLSFVSALVPDFYVRVLLASLFGGFLFLGWDFSPLHTHVLDSPFCDAFNFTRAFRAFKSVLKHTKDHSLWYPWWAHYENVKQKNKTKIL